MAAKKKSQPKHPLAQVAGWYGAAGIITGFLLISFEVISPQSIVYQLLNLSGALGLLILGLDRHVRQSVVINVFWVAIALIALIRLIIT